MFREAAEIALEVRERKEKGLPLVRLESLRGFEWVFDYSPA